MRDHLVQWFLAHGLPSWLVPGYWLMVVLAGFLGSTWFLSLSKKHGANTVFEGYAIIVGYVGALVGGYVIEAIRQLPAALDSGSLLPVLNSGRSAYGGLLGGCLLSAGFLRRFRQPVLPFFDRAVVLMGSSFALVRVGCFLAGCDFGRVTASSWGVRFPAHSPAALEHAQHGWIPSGAASLPVHPTQLYEAGLALLATGLALVALRRGPRDGRAVGGWLVCYAVGRFALEFLRGDGSRGIYLGLSTAQIVSIAILGALLLLRGVFWPAVRTSLLAAGTAVVLCLVSPSARAQTPEPPTTAEPASPPSAPSSTPTLSPPAAPALAPLAAESPSSPATDPRIPQAASLRRLRLRTSLGALLPLGRPAVLAGGSMAVDVTYGLRIGQRHRFELGLGLRGVRTGDTWHIGVDVPLRMVFGIARYFEMDLSFAPGFAHVFFDSPAFRDGASAFAAQLAVGFQFPMGSRVIVGTTPLAFGILRSADVATLATWEPKAWVTVGFL